MTSSPSVLPMALRIVAAMGSFGGAVAQSHEGTSERDAVDGAGDLDESPRAEDSPRARELDTAPGVAVADASQRSGDGDAERSDGLFFHVISLSSVRRLVT